MWIFFSFVSDHSFLTIKNLGCLWINLGFSSDICIESDVWDELRGATYNVM